MTRLREKYKTRVRPLALLSALAVIVLTVAAIWLLQDTGRRQENNTVWVNDGANVVPIVPAPGVAVNTLSPADFVTAEDGTIRYTGKDYIVRQGIDVSEHQGTVDWQQVADSGVEFAYIRLGYRGATEGGIYTDSAFEDNLTRACHADLTVGVYFFSQATDEQEAEEEADYLLSVLGEREAQLPVMFDWEAVSTEGSRSADVDGDTLHRCALAFCRRIEENGYAAGIYFNRQQGYYCYDLAALNHYAFWVSDLNTRPDFYYAFRFWQYTFSGTVSGIDGAVDRNMWFIPILAEEKPPSLS